MVRKGVHPLLHRVTVVMRNGASFQLATTMERTTPYFLREVRGWSCRVLAWPSFYLAGS